MDIISQPESVHAAHSIRLDSTLTMNNIKLISFQEKAGAAVGQRVKAVGMVFFAEKKDLVVGRIYSMRRQHRNPKDKNCVEILDSFVRPKAVLNRDVASFLSPLFDQGKIINAEW